MYKLVYDARLKGPLPNVILRVEDGVFIPLDPANRDCQAYLAWLEAGNEPLPADE